jgi:hypothetical protein
MLFLLISMHNVKVHAFQNPIDSKFKNAEFILNSAVDTDSTLKRLAPMCREMLSFYDSINSDGSYDDWVETEDARDENVLRAKSLKAIVEWLAYMIELSTTSQVNVMDVIEKCRLLSNEISSKVKQQCDDLKELANKAAQVVDEMETLKFVTAV